MLTVGSIITGKVVDVDFAGQGIIKAYDVVIFVKGLLMDEVAEIRIKALKKRFAEADVLNIIERSTDRREHQESHLGSLDLVHMSDEAQLTWQSRLTKETFWKIAKTDVEVEPIITDYRYEYYRNKSVFHVMSMPTLTFGLYKKDGHGLAKVRHFSLSDHTTNAIIEGLSKARIFIDFSIFKQIAIRTNLKGEALVTLISMKKSFKGLNDILRYLQTLNYVIGVTLNIKDDSKKILGETSITLFGESIIYQRVQDIDYPVTDQSFFQVNVPVIIKAYDIIKSNLLNHMHVIDAYSGVGVIGYYIASNAKKVTMIESNKDAYTMANMIKKAHHYDHVEIVLGTVEQTIEQVNGDVIILDPPRNGLMPELLTHLVEKPYKQCFYLSCDLKTLSRDMYKLLDAYNIKKIYPIRMFPQTTECETLVILVKK